MILVKASDFFAAFNAYLIAEIINGIKQLNGSSYVLWKGKLEVILSFVEY